MQIEFSQLGTSSALANLEYPGNKDLLRNNRVAIPQPSLDKYKPKYGDIHSRSTNITNAGTVHVLQNCHNTNKKKFKMSEF